jgi:sialate O-acetylesterase
MKLRRSLFGALFLALSTLPLAARADVKLPKVIGDNMVVQRDIKIPIWGTADPGERVEVSLEDRHADATADAHGHWKAVLGALPAGGPYELTIAGKNKITLKNVLVGEVWVCSGQSNMEMSVNRAMNAEQDIAAANYPKIRLFTVPKKVAETPLDDIAAGPNQTVQWVECSPQTVPGFSAVGYFFGRDLYKALDVPIGLIHTSWGGTPAESWTSKETLEADPELRPIAARWEKTLRDYPEAKEKYEKQLATWKEEAAKAKAEGKPEPRRPVEPLGPQHPHRAAGLYNAMITPLVPYAVRGAIWYQGESNAGRAYQYRKLLPAMIRDWRKAWQNEEFPFLIVQLANFMQRAPEPGDSDWAELREAQLQTLSVPHTGLGVTIDIGEANDIHPKNKQDVGHRLALIAEATTYGKDVEYSGPSYASMHAEGSAIRLRFTHAGGGLVAKRGDKLEGFAIAGKDRKFHWAEAKIDGDSVVVRSDQVADPVAVRYAWANNPATNLYNKAGLPASPFRTDDWEGITADKR